MIPEVIARTASEALPVSAKSIPRFTVSNAFLFVCQSDKLVELRMRSGVITVPGVGACCADHPRHIKVVGWQSSRAILTARSASLREASG